VKYGIGVFRKCIVIDDDQKLVHGLQVPTIDNFLTIVFRVGL
jgi:hypothetical protein